MQTVVHYFDYKSPYAYLAQEGTFNIANRDDVKMVWVPYGLKIGKYLGEAALDDAGEDTVKTRNDHQWRRVRYSYMDCRREANKKGLTLLGPKKIFDSSLSHMAFLSASSADAVLHYRTFLDSFCGYVFATSVEVHTRIFPVPFSYFSYFSGTGTGKFFVRLIVWHAWPGRS